MPHRSLDSEDSRQQRASNERGKKGNGDYAPQAHHDTLTAVGTFPPPATGSACSALSSYHHASSLAGSHEESSIIGHIHCSSPHFLVE
jgi:hypothetical protein